MPPSPMHRVAVTLIITASFYYFNLHSIILQDYWSVENIYHDLPEQHSRLVSSSSSSFLPQSTSNTHQEKQLPQWLDDYFHWHNPMRRQYPGTSILTHPNSPGVLVKVCAHKCGGLHDRLGGLGWDLYLANQTRRVLLIHWCIPAPIENYLVPNLMDWTLPRNKYTDNNNISSTSSSSSMLSSEEEEEEESVLDDRLFSNTTVTHTHCDRAVQNWPGLFDGYSEYRPGSEFWESHVDLALDRATNGEYSNHTILRVKILGFDEFLEKRLQERHGETDAIGWTDSFPTMFWRMFRPSVGLQKELDAALVDLNLSLPGTSTASASFDETIPFPSLSPYFAVHVRIRHPRGHVGQTIKGLGFGNPDKDGLQWEDGSTRDFAVAVSEHAFHCAQKRARISTKGKERNNNSFSMLHVSKPIYFFFADSEELVSHMGIEYINDGLRVRNTMGRRVVHIDRQQELSPESYYDSFIDLFIAAQAS